MYNDVTSLSLTLSTQGFSEGRKRWRCLYNGQIVRTKYWVYHQPKTGIAGKTLYFMI